MKANTRQIVKPWVVNSLRKSIEDYLNNKAEKENRCVHDSCLYCNGTGTNKYNGQPCVHMISCRCSKCSSGAQIEPWIMKKVDESLRKRFPDRESRKLPFEKNMNKPIGATQKQLDDNNIEWVLCGDYGHRDTHEPQWALRHSSEYDWAKERTMLLQEIANLRRQVTRLEGLP